MRILYVASRYDYGYRQRGLSFEHTNFFDCLHHMGHDILYFDYMALMQERGRDWMNRRLEEVVKTERPDLMFTFLAEEELERDTVSRITNSGDTVTFNWFADDTTRFDNFTRYWAPRFHWVATTAQSALSKYVRIGYKNVIKSQWATNPFSYGRRDLPLKYDVTFVGQPHSDRRQVIEGLRQAGVSVTTWGYGWELGRLSQEGMIEVFNQSRINLNLSNYIGPKSGPYTQVSDAIVGVIPDGSGVKQLVARGLRRVGRTRIIKVVDTTRNGRQYTRQIKGRNFEVPGCGGFMLTGTAENLEDYYRVGKEIVCYKNIKQLINRVQYYLQHEDERDTIAEAGYRRTRTEHTYVHRFNEIFRFIGLPHNSEEVILGGRISPGIVEEVTA